MILIARASRKGRNLWKPPLLALTLPRLAKRSTARDLIAGRRQHLRVAVKELRLSYHNSETILFAIYPLVAVKELPEMKLPELRNHAIYYISLLW